MKILIEFLVGLSLFIGIIMSVSMVLYMVGLLTLPRFDIKGEKDPLVIILGGVLGSTIVSGILALCYAFYVLGNHVLNN